MTKLRVWALIAMGAVGAWATLTACRDGGKLPPWDHTPASGLKLPTASARTAPQEALALSVSRAGIDIDGRRTVYLNGWWVDRRLTVGDEHGRLIFPLYQALVVEARVLRRIAGRGGRKFRGELALFSAREAPMSMVRQVLYTAWRAGFRRFQLITRQPGGALGMLYVEPLGDPALSGINTSPDCPGNERRLRYRRGLELELRLTPAGLALSTRHGSACPAKLKDSTRICFPAPPGAIPSTVLRDLKLHLWLLHWELREEKHYALYQERKELIVAPDPARSYGDLVRVLDAVREYPRDAANPPVKHVIPRQGCTMYFHRESGDWRFKETEGLSPNDTACMYHRVKLELRQWQGEVDL